MRKLAIACVSVAAAVFLSFYLFPLKLILPLALLCAAAAVILLPFRQRGDAAERAFLCALGAAVGFGAYSLHWNTTMRYAEQWDGTEQTMTACVMEMPTEGGYYTRIHVQRTESPKLDMMLYDYGEERPELRPGDILRADVKLRRADLFHGERNNSYISKDIYLTGTLKSMERYGSSRITIRLLAARCSGFLSAFAAKLFPEDTAVFMRALMLGDKTDFYRDTALYARMRGAGFMHVVAVSGMHIAFLVGMIQLLFGARPASSIAGILLVWFFVFMTGATPSAVRAGIMQTILVMAPIFRRENDGPTSLAAALALILVLNPFSCASISLQMSFSAMAGMILLAEPLTDTMLRAFSLREDGPFRAPVAVIASSLAVLIVSAPVTVLHFGTLAAYSPLMNLLGLWAVSLCFCGGWISCLSGLLFLPLGQFLAVPTTLLARYLITLAGIICRLPHHLIVMRGPEMTLWLLLSYLLAGLGWRCRGNSRFRVLMPLCLCVISLAGSLWSARQRYRSADGVIAALDVGQGACVCALAGEQTVMFDCGGLGTLNSAGETAADWLEAAGRDRVNLLVLSHLHEDHCNGVPMLLELMPVEEIILSPNADMDEALLPELLDAAEKHGTKITLLTEDTERREENVRLRMIAPPDSGSENERCIISLVSIGDYDMIFTGDSLKKEELRMIEEYEVPDAELLIVGHHGSQSSSDEAFLRAVQAEDAIISVGYNSYGHPTREVLARLQVNGYRVYRTDQNGTVEIRVNHH